MWQDWLVALALVLVLEGLLPFLSPMRFREAMQRVIEFSDNALRYAGLASMLIGVVLLYLVH